LPMRAGFPVASIGTFPTPLDRALGEVPRRCYPSQAWCLPGVPPPAPPQKAPFQPQSGNMRLLPSLLTVALAPICSRPCAAQVTISEVDASATQAWVELLNRGPNEVDLSNWSLYHATKTPHRSGTYWFAFPAGTRIAADGFLR